MSKNLIELSLEELNETSPYVCVQDEGYQDVPIVNRQLYVMSVWRLRYDFERSEPIFEKLEDIYQPNEEDAAEEVKGFLEENALVPLAFTDEEFESVTGMSLGQVTLDG